MTDETVKAALSRLTANVYDPECRAAKDAETIRNHIEQQAAKVEALERSLAEARDLLRDIRPVISTEELYRPCSDLRERIDAAMKETPHAE